MVTKTIKLILKIIYKIRIAACYQQLVVIGSNNYQIDLKLERNSRPISRLGPKDTLVILILVVIWSLLKLYSKDRNRLKTKKSVSQPGKVLTLRILILQFSSLL